MLRNRDGTPVDPVPFLVVTALAFMLTFSFGPLYAGAVGLPLPVGLALSTGLFAVVGVGAYVRLVRNARPALRAEIPSETRLARLVYGALCLALVGLLLALPLM